MLKFGEFIELLSKHWDQLDEDTKIKISKTIAG